MTLLEVVESLKQLDESSTIYAAEPWVEDSRAIVTAEPEDGALPSEAVELGLTYFLEVFLARDFIEDWASTFDREPTTLEKCVRLIEYATNDA